MIVEDQNLKRMLINKEAPEPSPNLDANIMSDINVVLNRKPANYTYLFLAWIFLAIATVLGIAISVTWINLEKSILNLPNIYNGVINQILSAMIILLIFDRLYKLTYEIKKKVLT